MHTKNTLFVTLWAPEGKIRRVYECCEKKIPCIYCRWVVVVAAYFVCRSFSYRFRGRELQLCADNRSARGSGPRSSFQLITTLGSTRLAVAAEARLHLFAFLLLLLWLDRCNASLTLNRTDHRYWKISSFVWTEHTHPPDPPSFHYKFYTTTITSIASTQATHGQTIDPTLDPVPKGSSH